MNREQLYKRVVDQLSGLFVERISPVSRMATIAALLKGKFPDMLWVGFYLLQGDTKLQVGPYQGPLACINLPYPKGVCWRCVLDKVPVIVPNVHLFPGHIACDARSNSEIVVPVFDGDKIAAVLDADSKSFGCFDQTDALGLEAVCQMIYASNN